MVGRNGEDVTATEARQGHRDSPVLLVLLVSLGLAFVLLGLLLYFGVMKFPGYWAQNPIISLTPHTLVVVCS